MKKFILVFFCTMLYFLPLYARAAEESPSNSNKAKLSIERNIQQVVVNKATFFERTKGRWMLQGKDSPVSLIVMDGKGNFSQYTPVGALKMKGYLDYQQENDKGTYIMYSLDEKLVDSFLIENDNTVQLGEESVLTYIRHVE